jgi:protein gp37
MVRKNGGAKFVQPECTSTAALRIAARREASSEKEKYASCSTAMTSARSLFAFPSSNLKFRQLIIRKSWRNLILLRHLSMFA